MKGRGGYDGGMQRHSGQDGSGSAEGAARVWLELADEDLIGQCAVDVYRASGPGGQKRNKTSSAVRLRHEPTELMVIANESRSQHENRVRALRRLRQAIALNQRNAIDLSAPPPQFYRSALDRDASLRVNQRNPDYWLIVQHILDVVFACGGQVSAAGETLELSTGHLIRFLKNDPKLWEHANRLRAEFGHQPLR